MTGHVVIHITVGTVHAGTHILERVGNDPPLSAEHARHIRLEHVEGVIHGLFSQYGPRPTLGVLCEHLAKTETRILILEEDRAGIDQLLRILRKHAIHGGGIVHIRQRIPMRQKRIANLLELCLDAERFEKNDEYAFFNEGARFGIGNGLLDGGKAHVAIATCRAEDHAFEPHLLLGGDHSRDAAEAHVEIGTGLVVVGSGEEGAGFGGASSREFGDGEAGCVRHEEAAGFFEYFLEFHLFVVFAG
mmetsp:Transcript_18011/g.38898  ORF Transcript_18011/g.38898 Transcript_18011/m.38898 type:complete len:246 (+) Transcript_18011:1612-2349(+)